MNEDFEIKDRGAGDFEVGPRGEKNPYGKYFIDLRGVGEITLTGILKLYGVIDQRLISAVGYLAGAMEEQHLRYASRMIAESLGRALPQALVAPGGPLNDRIYRDFDVRHLKKLDIYRFSDFIKPNDHAIDHAIKKIVLSGIRTGAKSREKDLEEAIDTISRRLEMYEEDRGTRE